MKGKNIFYLIITLATITSFGGSILAKTTDSTLEEKKLVDKDSANEVQDKLQEDLKENSQSEEGGQTALQKDVEEVKKSETQEKATEEILQKMQLDFRGKPRFHLYDGEEVAVLSSSSSKTMVMMADNQFSRNLYNQDYKLTSRLTWVNQENTSPPVVESKDKAQDGKEDLEQAPPLVTPPRLSLQEDYYYYENSRMKEKVVLTNFLDTSRLESHYSPEGLVVKEEYFTYLPEEVEEKTKKNKNIDDADDTMDTEESVDKSLEENQEKNEDKKSIATTDEDNTEDKFTEEEKEKLIEKTGGKEIARKEKDEESDENSDEEEVPTDLAIDPWKDFPKLTLTSVTEYKYNEDGAVTEKISTSYYKEESQEKNSKKRKTSKKSKKQVDQALKKTLQRIVYQTPGDIYGGYELFEDEKLVVSRKYDEKGQCKETRYIDTMKIESVYDGARLLSEVIYLDGKELRRTEF